MAANMYGIDLGEVYRTTEAVKGARSRNRLADLQTQEIEREIAQRPEKEKRANILTQLRQQAVAGDDDAAQQLLALDPEGGATFIDAVSKMDERKLKATQRTVDELGQLSAYVLQGSTPEEQQRRYQVMYAGVSPEVQAKLPESFDPQFMELSLSKAMAMDKILENPKVIQVGGEDVVYKGGREIERKTRPVEDKVGAGGSGLKSADESLMFRQAGELLGGVFDQQGNITNLDPDTRNRVQAIATEAVKIYREQGNISRTEAVEMAGKKFGLNIPSATGNNDPLGIRQ
jgi:hypothetical protein